MPMRKRYTKTRKTYAKKRKSYGKKRRAAPRAQTLVIKIVGAGGGVQTSTATLGKKSGRPVYARF